MHVLFMHVNARTNATNAIPDDELQIANKTTDLIQQVYISPVAVRVKLLANTDGSNVRNFSNKLDYHNVLRFVFEYAEKGAFERDADFR